MTLPVQSIGGNPQQPSISAQTYIPDQLIAGPLQLVTDNALIASGQGVLARGTILGVVTASGKYIVSKQTATDGSQVPSAVLADVVDATSNDANGGIYLQGEFNGTALIFDSSWSLAALKPLLRPLEIYVKTSVSAADPS
ncbi:head decoration protein [Chromobacterium haemolyticum]|uniref:head decoration protein n=1 Tax=Chromobacterium TaxID=535 RepID=UPI004055AD7C